MFEKIVLRRSEDGQPPTLGDLAEAMLFYRRVHLVLDSGTVRNFSTKLGVQSFLNLLDRDAVSAVYCREHVATASRTVGTLVHHAFSGIEIVGSPNMSGNGKSDRYSTLELLRDTFKEGDRRSNRAATKLAEKFLEKVPVRSLIGKDFTHGGLDLIHQATADLYEQSFIVEAISCALQHAPGFQGFSNRLTFEIQQTFGGFTVFSNLDLRKTNDARRQLFPQLGDLSVAHLLNEVLTARADVMLASHYGSDFKTSITGSSIMELRYRELIRSAGIHATELSNFQNVIVNEGRCLKEVVDKGERTFDEFLTLVDQGKLFRNWSIGVNPDSSIVAEYLKEGARQGWINSLPGKSLRFAIANLLEWKIPGSGTAVGLTDSFLVEKLMAGWRPNHFIDDRVKPFVNNASSS